MGDVWVTHTRCQQLLLATAYIVQVVVRYNSLHHSIGNSYTTPQN